MDNYVQRLLYAGFWKRFLAWLIDQIVFSIPASIVFTFTGPMAPFIVLIGFWIYCAVLESSEKQATLGKMALHIIVTDINGNKIGFGRATGRFFAKILSGIILFIGYIMAAFTGKKQALHDIMAKTFVVNKDIFQSESFQTGKCPYCSADNAYNATFCCECGKKLKTGFRVCAKCGNEIKDGSKFCDSCGTPIE
jgi:uncharacterized RDD family membrane protein YckC